MVLDSSKPDVATLLRVPIAYASNNLTLLKLATSSAVLVLLAPIFFDVVVLVVELAATPSIVDDNIYFNHLGSFK